MSKQFQDDTFGLLEQDYYSPEYLRSQVEFSKGRVIEVTIDQGNEDLSQMLDGAHKIFDELKANEPRLRDAVADKYLPLYNESWRDGEEIDKEAFLAEMTLESIFISKADIYKASLSYVVGELFTDHAINVDINEMMQIEFMSLDG